MTLKQEWQRTKELVKTGYDILQKKVSINMPAVCLPASDDAHDTGIGAVNASGSEKFFDFFDGIFHQILLGPTGRTFAPLYSPYESTYGYNPLITDLQALTQDEGGHLLEQKALQAIYETPKTSGDINYPVVGKAYNQAWRAAYEAFEKRLAFGDAFAKMLDRKMHALWNGDELMRLDATFYAPLTPRRYVFEQALAATLQQSFTRDFIADLEVKLPDSLVVHKPAWFLKDFTLGSPADSFSATARNWHFKVFAPERIIKPDGTLAEAGKFMLATFDRLFKQYQGGVRIDHFIGFVNPFVFALNKGDESGRLYSSADNPKLKRYFKRTTKEFGQIVDKIILQAMRQNGKSVLDIYPEDLGARPPQLDEVMRLYGLGRMLVGQFVDVNDESHLYRLKNAKAQDVAVLDTHDTPTGREFFEKMDFEGRQQHAHILASDIRFNYSQKLTEPLTLLRMKWAELLACPALRVQAFFTSFTGQDGRYNEPGNPKKWRLRSVNDFETLYFKNLLLGKAYNPLDAIALAIYARGDAFYRAHQDFVLTLRAQEVALKQAIISTAP